MKIMKKRLLYLFMLVCSVSIFMSCSDDDDEVKYPIDTYCAHATVGVNIVAAKTAKSTCFFFIFIWFCEVVNSKIQ